ncbi:30S ribosomal protein S3Ae [Candidatus Norongarragalina meridionalis]|nr:30S ribosomal protein S3Ae [Candidatus Norongarragalina meridionalis]
MAVPVAKKVEGWKAKKWYQLVAPKVLGEGEIALIPATDDEHIINRIIKIPLKEITRDMSHAYTNVFLRVYEVREKKAYSKYIGHEIARELIGTMVRRKRDALLVVFPAKSKEGIDFTIKAIIITQNPCSGRQKTTLRKALIKILQEKAASEDFGQFIHEVLFGKVSAEAFEKLDGIIVPLKRIEIKKTELYEEFDVEETKAEEKAEEKVEAPVESSTA